MYQLPPDVSLDDLSAEVLDNLAAYLELYGSLPFINRGVDLSSVDMRALEGMQAAIEAAHVELARTSAAAFVQYAFRHEETNALIENARHHQEWHEFLDDHNRAILFAPVEHGKTQQVIGRVLWTLGKNPNKRIAIVSNTFEPHATKILKAIRTHIESNPRVHKVFPHLRPSENDGDPWGQAHITVQRDTIAKDPSVQALGLFGPINGSRLDGIILDDILNFENTRTPEMIQKTLGWLDSEVFTRATEHGFIHWIGTPWNPLDPMHEVAKRPAWASKRYCAVENPDEPMTSWRPIWPEQFSLARLTEIYGGTSPLNFARKYLCQVRMDSASRFQMEWIENAKRLGAGRRLVDRQPHGFDGRAWPCFTGVDIGIGQKEGHDLTVLFTVAVDERGRKCVVDIQAGRWPAPDIVQRIHGVVRRYNSHVLVEDNQAQAFIVQWAGQDGLPVTGFTTTGGKKYDEHFGVESLAVEMRNGGWLIPSGAPGEMLHPELEAWIQEMLFYTPDAHTGDRLMASWLAREAARAGGFAVARTVDTLTR